MAKKPRHRRKPKRGVSRITTLDTPQSHTHTVAPRQIRQSTYAAQYYSGPVLPPNMIREWEEICPGSADRFLELHENQADHRQTLEKMVVGSNIKNEGRGQFFAFVLFAITLIGGFILTGLGIQVAGMATIIGAIAAGVGLFIYQKKEGKNELKNKRKTIERAPTEKQIESAPEKKQLEGDDK